MQAYGFDKPLPLQFVRTGYGGRCMATGMSVATGRPVLRRSADGGQLFAARLALLATIIGFCAG